MVGRDGGTCQGCFRDFSLVKRVVYGRENRDLSSHILDKPLPLSFTTESPVDIGG